MIIQKLKSVIRKTLTFLEKSGSYDLNPSLGPIFIIGAPRTGSTLLYQLIVEAYNVSYFSNMHRIMRDNLPLAEYMYRLLRLFSQDTHNNFSSNYGQVRGLTSPSEAGEYWSRFFDNNIGYASLNDVDEAKMSELVHSISKFQNTVKRPIVIKNLPIGLKLDVILRFFPNSLFIVTKKDVADNAHSILRARHKNNGNYEDWWSLEPANIKNIQEKSPAVQVVEQVRGINKHIDNARKTCPHQFIDAPYDDLCNDPWKVLEKIENFLALNNVKVKRNKNKIPQSFEMSRKKIDAFNAEIEGYVKKS